ncbi:ecdysteroid 22-kinase family protein [Novosphingobium sp. FKTRR1]|uniref:ecdysteroid 22-kinase family protein n=1 Tax=Novosphingobium sp. FKTRR1 TaxID=2879118 RepID=UPI001CF0671B|nr:ecdysteroid 22-kinase family protein [Novosphingobium sp. FKTRR1]
MQIPPSPYDLSPALLTDIVGQVVPGAAVDSVTIIKSHEYGDGDVSTSARATARLDYSAQAPADLPRDVILKLSFDPRKKGTDAWYCQLDGLFANEVNFYNRIRPSLAIEAPASLGGHFDPESKRYLLIMEDVTSRGATFPSNLDEVGVENVKHILDAIAKVHALYWKSDRFAGDLAWVETHLSGGVENHMRSVIPQEGIRSQLELHKFKRELLERLGTTERELFAGMCANKRHQAALPQTLLHGDLHIGNTYRMPDLSVGLHDWQLCVRGFALHDVTYIINTALSIAERREHERALLDYYRDKLIEFGVGSPPTSDVLWTEHRRAALWTLYIGWLTCPPESYGWETMALALLRVSTAVEDHRTLSLVRETL